MNLGTDSDILIVLDNHAKSLNLQSSGNFNDQPGSSILIEQSAVLTEVDVIPGDGPGECFTVLSDMLAVFVSGIANVTEGCWNIRWHGRNGDIANWGIATRGSWQCSQLELPEDQFAGAVTAQAGPVLSSCLRQN